MDNVEIEVHTCICRLLIHQLFFGICLSGQRRFSKPEPPLRWNGVRDATRFGYECHQRDFPGYQPYRINEKPVPQNEDCLYLNIYAPVGITKTRDRLAVMVWIHGGGFYVGAGSQYDGSELATSGVIVVSINYRLDIFGFLSNEDEDIPGNYGMLDQIMALQWVQKNIGSFGGDPAKVTVFGESAGASSVSLLVLSPLASGLFRRAIISTGVSLSPWALIGEVTRMSPRTTLALIGQTIGCSGSKHENTKLLQCFRNVDAKTLFNASKSLQIIFNARIIFAPRVETTFSFLPDLPINLLIKNKFNHVDSIHGFPSDGFGSEVIALSKNINSRDDFRKIVRKSLEPYAFTEKERIIEEITELYIGNETDVNNIRKATVREISDFMFSGPTIIEADIQSILAETNDHYMYEFYYKPSLSSRPPSLNAVHGEDIPFIFGVNLPEFQIAGKTPNEDDQIVWNQIKTFWSNFAKYGNPSETLPPGAQKWTPYSARNKTFLKISKESLTMSYVGNKASTMYRHFLQKLQGPFNIRETGYH